MMQKTLRSARLTAAPALAALLVVGFVPSAANAATSTIACKKAPTNYRQLIGTISSTSSETYLEASVPTAGSYAFEYEVTSSSAAFFDTYVNGQELGYVGGPNGTYRTRSLALSAGGQLVKVVGPNGSGSAKVYVVSTS